jgi:hypothetical protein
MFFDEAALGAVVNAKIMNCDDSQRHQPVTIG